MADPTERSWTDADVATATRKKPVPEGLWVRCIDCGAILFRRALENNLSVCPECSHHFRISAPDRVAHLADVDSFIEMDEDVTSADPLGFVDTKPYPDRLAAAKTKTGANEAVLCGTAFIKGRKVVLAAMDFRFLGGSMGSAVGEKIARAIEVAIAQDLPLIVVAASGGARMMESGLSLMQMAKTSAALARLDEMGGLFISVLTDPTTGGVTASFAMLGDVILAEPKALIGFAGPRVIKNTIRQDLPDGFQRSEFLLEHGFVDRVVDRHDLRSEISSLIDYAGK
ncbi:MAG: acetyl-CoA carboxylase carboxyltransferase subunit beta [Planctomycetes bacterium]|nr:acetyl-CoA carboxylase carboxyltransferase subunit beta [Planctomycetota bacterium]MCP4838761.1 acetyl-CoA carboxylase carboxyltransferase subunit beta [Planctomycetota bacterium]